MEKLYTDNFQHTVRDILSEYSSKRLRLMISGGSVLPLFDSKTMLEMDTSLWTIYYSDERIDSSDLNYTSSIPFLRSTQAKAFPIFSGSTPAQNASAYADTCIYVDVAFLGVGEDGHIASLFPDSATLDSTEYFVFVDNSPKMPPKRITATVRFLNERVDRLFFLIPPKNGQLKDVVEPHRSIVGRLNRSYVVYLDHRKRRSS